MSLQPNIELEMADLPRPTEHPGAPRRWSPGRAAELGGPGDVPRGGRFGTPGPDSGYALRLLASREIPAAPGENPGDVAAGLAAVMAARAAAFGRGPVPADAEAAELILGYADGAPAGLAELRASLIRGLAHHPAAARGLVAAVDREVLGAGLTDLADRAAAGEAMIGI
jgi:hypothetical protein